MDGGAQGYFRNIYHLRMHADERNFVQVNMEKSIVALKFDSREEHWNPGESLLRKLETIGVVKEIFPIHGTICSLLFMDVEFQTLKTIFACCR